MNRSRFRVLAVAASTLFVATLMAAPAAANAAGGTYYPSGPQVNVPLSTVTGGGWTLCWSEAYDASGSSIANIIAGTAAGSISPCNEGRLMLTGWDNSNPNVLPVLAAAAQADVIALTPIDAPALSNGTYWYHNSSIFFGMGAIGFSPNSSVAQSPCDVAGFNNGTQAQRLCWHLHSDDTLFGGWSLGESAGLNGNGNYTRAIFTQQAPRILHKGSKTGAGALAAQLKVTTPAGGSLVVSVSDASSGACSVSGNKLYAFGTGACEVTVTSLKANGDTKVSKSKTYLVN